MGRYTDIVKSLPRPACKDPANRISADPMPVIPLDQVRAMIDGFDAKFLGVKPKGWLPMDRDDE
jgi:hypothetical protein